MSDLRRFMVCVRAGRIKAPTRSLRASPGVAKDLLVGRRVRHIRDKTIHGHQSQIAMKRPGRLRDREQVDKTKTELLIFLTPHAAQQPEALGSMSQDEVNGTKLTPNAIAPGVMQEHLQGMQRGGRSQTQPASQPTPSLLEIKPGTDSNYQTPTQTIPLPIR